MKNYIKHWKWFINESASFLNKSKLWVLTHGFIKAHKFALDMCKWDKMTHKEKELWYLNENRVVEIEI